MQINHQEKFRNLIKLSGKKPQNVLTGTQTPDKTRRIKYIFFSFVGGGRRGEGNCFPNNDFLALGESQPSLAVVLKSTAGPGELTQRIFNEVVAYV